MTYPGRVFVVVMSILGVLGVPDAWADPKFQIGAIKKRKTGASTITINGKLPPVEQKIEFSATLAEDMPSKDLVVLIYFFDENKKKIWGFTPALDTDQSVVGPDRILVRPPTMKSGKKYGFWGTVGEEIEEKWKHILVVVGKQGEYTVRMYPKEDYTKFDFPEKGSVTWSSQQ